MQKKDIQDIQAKFKNIAIEPSLIKNTLNSNQTTQALLSTIKQAQIDSCSKKIGNLLYTIATKFTVNLLKHRKMVSKYLGQQKIYNSSHLNYIIDYLKGVQKKGEKLDVQEFQKECGIGRMISVQQIQNETKKFLKSKQQQLNNIRYSYNKGEYMSECKKNFPYVDGKVFNQVMTKQINNILGEETKEDREERERRKKKKGQKYKSIIRQKNTQQPIKRLEELIARDMNTLLNTKQLLQQRDKVFGNKVYTRFPPEPNGYLHIGHAKSMRFNFKTAKVYNGHCYLRYDDTNPQKESQQYIKSIYDTVRYMGYEPFKITHSSDRFQQIYQFAISLIKNNKAFVCFQSKQLSKSKRKEGLPSKYRDTPIEESLRLFQQMRLGLYQQGQVCLRAKIDYKHANTTLRDPAIYRIKYKQHPHAKDQWCIYPLYDFTHPICDSLQGITHSLCTLQFEIRRDLYYWVLQNLQIYKPYVWEFSRLNISNTVLSKRKLQILVQGNYIKGWDDPRIYTIMGMRRRGFTSEVRQGYQAINQFCDLVSVTRRGNEKIIQMSLLEHCVRKDLDKKCGRRFVVIEPVLMQIVNLEQDFVQIIQAPDFPKQVDTSFHTLFLTKYIYVEKSDIILKDNPNFYGIAPQKYVTLKYSKTIFITKIQAQNDVPLKVYAQIRAECPKSKGFLHWLSVKHSVKCTFNMYSDLFNCSNPSEAQNFLTKLNIKSLQIKEGYMSKEELKRVKVQDKYQFQRLGFFCVDRRQQDNVVWNKTIGLVQKCKKNQ